MPPRGGVETAGSRMTEFDALDSSNSKSGVISNYGSANGTSDTSSTNDASLRDILLRAPSDLRGSLHDLKSFIEEHTGESSPKSRSWSMTSLFGYQNSTNHVKLE